MINFNARDLENRAGTLDARGQLPDLVRRLILTTTDRTERSDLRFPGGSSIDLSGWDGWTNVSAGNSWVPTGCSGWEVSCEKDVRAKAQSDYANRQRGTDPEDAKGIAFVFVTPRRWASKEEWAEERRREGLWADVRVIDADDLIAWLEDARGVAVGLAATLGKPVDGVVALDLFWKSWSGATSLATTPELVIAGRTREQELVAKWSSEPASVISIRGDTKREAVAFIAACAYAQYEEWEAGLLANAVVVDTLNAWQRLEQQSSAMVLIRTFDSEWSPGIAIDRGHSVAVALDTSQPARESLPTLQRLGRADAISALRGMGRSEYAARLLLRQPARRLVFIRLRLMNQSNYAAPDWCSTAEPEQIAILTLIGKWEGDNDGSYSFVSDSGHFETRVGQPGEGDGVGCEALQVSAGEFDQSAIDSYRWPITGAAIGVGLLGTALLAGRVRRSRSSRSIFQDRYMLDQCFHCGEHGHWARDCPNRGE